MFKMKHFELVDLIARDCAIACEWIYMKYTWIPVLEKSIWTRALVMYFFMKPV